MDPIGPWPDQFINWIRNLVNLSLNHIINGKKRGAST